MPAIHHETFRVRHYECDALGHLNNANYARYMQEAAFEASAAVGYSKARYEEMGHLWLARETQIEYLKPLRYGDTVRISTWVGDFRRVRSRRFYEFHRADELVAHASTDWVYLEGTTGRPAAVPPDMIAAFVPEGLTEKASARDPFRSPPAPPPRVFSHRRHVEWRDIDTAGHVNNAVYLNYIEDCAMQLVNAFGWPRSRSLAAGWAAVARSHHIEYQTPALLDDELEITTWVTPHGRTSADRFYRITRPADGASIAQAWTHWVWVDIATQRPIRIPDDFWHDFRENISE